MLADGKGGGMEADAKAADASKYYDHLTPNNNRQSNQITLTRVNTPTRKILRKFDDNEDGRIDTSEIQNIVKTLVAEKFKSKAFKIGLIILCLFTTVLLGAIFGLTWAVVAAFKDTQVQNLPGGLSILVTNDRRQNPVMVGNVDLTVDARGTLVSRENSTVVTTSTLQAHGSITTNTPFEKLLAIQNLVLVDKASTARYSLAVLGVARIPSSMKEDDFILRFITAAGTLSLEGETWSASDTTGPMLDSLFTASDGRGHRRVESGIHYYVICEADGCGEAIPCGLPGLDLCPNTTSIVDPSPGYEEPLIKPAGENNTGTVGSLQLYVPNQCTNPTPLVYNCEVGLYWCYGVSPTSTQITQYKRQYACTSLCGSGWYKNLDGWCEGSTPRTYCCV